MLLYPSADKYLKSESTIIVMGLPSIDFNNTPLVILLSLRLRLDVTTAVSPHILRLSGNETLRVRSAYRVAALAECHVLLLVL